MIKCATWNVCLGLANKKDIVLNELRRQEIKICGLQEVEIKNDFPVTALSSKDYKIETETNAVKSPLAM